MDDLISRKKLLSDINIEEDKILSCECESPVSLPALQWFRAAIAGQPTAYDIEAVIELLESLKHPYMTFSESLGILDLIDYYVEKAERFVRSCGIDAGLNLSYQDRIEALHRYKENCEKAGGRDE